MNFEGPLLSAATNRNGDSKSWILIVLLASLYSCSSLSNSDVDPLLIESIRWYTGENGTVDDENAKQLLQRAAADGDALSTM